MEWIDERFGRGPDPLILIMVQKVKNMKVLRLVKPKMFNEGFHFNPFNDF